MIKAQDIAQVKAFARQDGVFLSLLWIISFACWYGVMRHTGNNADTSSVQQMDTSFGILSLLSNLLIIATPFFVGWRLIKFRDDALNGTISFRRGYAYSVYTFLYASMIFAVVHYLYFTFLDGGMFVDQMKMAIVQLTSLDKTAGTNYSSVFTDENFDLLKTMKPINWALMFMIQNIGIGFLASLPIAFVCKRNYLIRKQ